MIGRVLSGLRSRYNYGVGVFLVFLAWGFLVSREFALISIPVVYLATAFIGNKTGMQLCPMCASFLATDVIIAVLYVTTGTPSYLLYLTVMLGIGFGSAATKTARYLEEHETREKPPILWTLLIFYGLVGISVFITMLAAL